jgi:hypothetical protein
MNIWKKYLKYYNVKPVDAVKFILDGFPRLSDAQEYLEMFHDRDTITFTAHGYEVSPKDFENAMKIAQKKGLFL